MFRIRNFFHFIALSLLCWMQGLSVSAETRSYSKLEWLPEHNLIAMADEYNLYLFSPDLRLVETIAIVNPVLSNDEIRYFDWSPDGNLFLVALNIWDGRSDHGTVAQIWDFSARRMKMEFISGGFIDAWHPQGKYLAILDSTPWFNQQLVIRDINTGTLTAMFPLDVTPGFIVWHPDGQHLLTGSVGNFTIWDMKAQIAHPVTVSVDYHSDMGIIFSPSGEEFLVPSIPLDRLDIWNFNTLEQVGSIQGFTDIIRSFSWQDAGILTTSLDKMTRLWNPETGKAIFALSTGVIREIALSPDNTKVVMRTMNQQIIVRELKTGHILARLCDSIIVDVNTAGCP